MPALAKYSSRPMCMTDAMPFRAMCRGDAMRRPRFQQILRNNISRAQLIDSAVSFLDIEARSQARIEQATGRGATRAPRK